MFRASQKDIGRTPTRLPGYRRFWFLSLVLAGLLSPSWVGPLIAASDQEAVSLPDGGSEYIVDDQDDWVQPMCFTDPCPGHGFKRGGNEEFWWQNLSPQDIVYQGRALWTGGTPDESESSNWATWAAGLPDSGPWEVSVFVPKVNTNRNDTTRARYCVGTQIPPVSPALDGPHGSASGVRCDEVVINQANNLGRWVVLDTFEFPDRYGYVNLSDWVAPGDPQFPVSVLFDAVRWRRPGGDEPSSGSEIAVRWLASPRSYVDCQTPEPCCWWGQTYADSSWAPISMPVLNDVAAKSDRFYRGYFDLPVAADVQISFRSDDGLWLYLDGQKLGEDSFSLWFTGCSYAEGCFNGGNPGTRCGLDFEVAPVWAHLEAGRHVIAADLENAIGGSYIDIHVRAAVPETAIAVALDRGEGGVYRIGDPMNLCYSVSRPVSVRFLVCPDGEGCRIVMQGNDDGTGGCQPGRVGGTPGRRRLVAQALAAGAGSAVIAEDEASYVVLGVEPSCTDSAELLEQSSQSAMDPGTAFDAYFEIKNTGRCAWDSSSGYGLRRIAGDAFGEDDWQPLSTNINASSRVRFRLSMKAPNAAGRHESTWQMEHNGTRFGPMMKLSIEVKPAICGDDAQIVSQYGGGTVSPGSVVNAWIEYRNSGSCVWHAAQGYELVSANGQTYGAASPQRMSKDVAPGGSIRFQIDLVEPPAAGEAVSDWRMRSMSAAFGPTAQLRFTVAAAPRSTDLGFRPEPNGHRGENKTLFRTEQMFRQFFGEENVARNGSLCRNARDKWLKEYRNVAGGWSCVGYSLTSLLAFSGFDAGADQSFATPWSMPRLDRLYDETTRSRYDDQIKFFAGIQENNHLWNDEIRSYSWGACNGNGIGFYIDRIREALERKEPLVLGLLSKGNAHAVVPYRLVQEDANKVSVWIYDSAYPGVERTVTISRVADGQPWSWAYVLKGMQSLSADKRRNCESMFLIRLRSVVKSPQIETSICDSPAVLTADLTEDGSLRAASSAANARVIMSLPGTAVWQIVGKQGDRIGWAEDGLPLLGIADAIPLPNMSSGAVANQHFSLPAGSYRIEGSTTVANTSREVSGLALADGRSISWGVTSQTGELEVPTLEIDASKGAATVLDAQGPGAFSAEVIVERSAGAHASELLMMPVGALAGVGMRFDGDDAHVNTGPSRATYTLTFTGNDAAGDRRDVILTMGPEEDHRLTVMDWDHLTESDVSLEIDRGADGSIDERRILRAFGRVYLPLLSQGQRLDCPVAEREPNDSRADADRYPSMCSGWPIHGQLVPGDVRDAYLVVVERPMAMEAFLNPDDGSGDIDLYLFREGAADFAAKSENSGSAHERISVWVEPGRYYLLAFPAGGKSITGSYAVSWNEAP